ncbi:unnamed protein product [Spirodela intermedia]|uniref:DUF7392 domain-containing protein n=1 Tax=Spirodela intermedia TaxID=51605 RepID=A0A7I8JIC9_SPIIN|nr:unnamed protein product [Spirodela intermedia]CAA6669909.1 unnamed protein product [Spirodela intermedia]
MPCFVPFNGKKMDLSFFVFRHVGVFAEELIEALKFFSFFCEDLGCIYSATFKSIHGNMIVWYGAWVKRPDAQRRLLIDHLISVLEKVSHLAVLLDHGFFESYVGESKDGRSALRFVTGDTVSMAAMTPISGDPENLSYACMALLNGGACFSCLDKPMVASMQVWKSLHDCYAWLINSDYRTNIRPYLSHLANDCEYEVFNVVFVSSDELLPVQLLPSPAKMIDHSSIEGEDEMGGMEQAESSS